jgi:hypothetical protein
MVRDKPDSFTLLHATRRGAAYEWKLNDLEEKDLADLWKKVSKRQAITLRERLWRAKSIFVEPKPGSRNPP